MMTTMPGCLAFLIDFASKRPLRGRRDGRDAAGLSPAGIMNRWRLAWLAAVLLASGTTVAAPMISVSRTLLDWGNVSFGVPTTPQSFDVTNVGDAPLELNAYVMIGYSGFDQGGPCDKVFILAPGASCRMDITLTVTNQHAGQIAARFEIESNGGIARVDLRAFNTGQAGPPPTVAVVEYYNAVLDHYFITWMPDEQTNLDAGNTPTRWTRTGYSFRAFTTPQAGTSPVCRYYIPPALGDSHFFGRGTAECDATGQQNPSFVLESSDFMRVYLPVNGVCPAGTTAVYRVFSDRADANHRYMIDRSLRDFMVGGGWLAEGDGPDLVVMCAPA
jgi:hypothetical protein